MSAPVEVGKETRDPEDERAATLGAGGAGEHGEGEGGRPQRAEHEPAAGPGERTAAEIHGRGGYARREAVLERFGYGAETAAVPRGRGTVGATGSPILIAGGSMQIASLGLNWWLTPFFSVGMKYRYIWNTRLGEDGTSSGLNSRILLLLE